MDYLEAIRQFENHCYSEVLAKINEIPEGFVSSIYAISFYIYCVDDEEEQLSFTLGYNTVDRLAECSPTPDKNTGWPMASSISEAKWNFAFWIQNDLLTIGLNGTESGDMRDKFIDAAKLLFGNEKDAFVNLLVKLARKLHKSGLVVTKFQKNIPIIIHELEYYDKIAHQTSAANPGGIADEFVGWVLGDDQ